MFLEGVRYIQIVFRKKSRFLRAWDLVIKGQGLQLGHRVTLRLELQIDLKSKIAVSVPISSTAIWGSHGGNTDLFGP
eukprot:SAG11_NODE_24039_length_379_cov_0.610714_1_plen_76_part_01